MNLTSDIIATLSNEDKRKFKNELKQKNKRNDTKNLELFELLESQTKIKNIDEVLYGKRARGAYHALSKRLHDTLIDFIATKNFEKESSEEMDALKLVLASRIFFQHKQYKLAFKTLSKAEIKASKYDIYSILNEVYSTLIMYAHVDSTISLPVVIKKYQQNKKNIEQEEKLNMFYATVHKELIERKSKAIDIITNNIALFDISISENLSYQSLFKIIEISNQVAHITRDYYAVFNFIEMACKKIETSERIQSKHLNEHIRILYYLANMNFRTKDFNKSRMYLDKMRSYMSTLNNKFYDSFLLQYALLENLLHIYTGKATVAIDNISSMDLSKFKKQSEYVLDLNLALVASYFLHKNFKEALKTYNQFHRSDTWYAEKNGHIWVIKKNLLEILILMELNYLDLVESRCNSFLKKHRVRLIQFEETRILDFLKFARMFYYNTEDFSNDSFRQKTVALLQIKNKTEDIFVLSFCAWLQSKIDKSDMYETCLSFIDYK